MSTEVTPESLRTHAEWLDEQGSITAAPILRKEADCLERQQRHLPTVPGWYPTIVVERGGESCTGALLTEDRNWWCTAEFVDGNFLHRNSDENTIRWAGQVGTTPGQTLWETEDTFGCMPWGEARQPARDRAERIAAAVLAAHGTPTLTPVGEHPKPGTRGLLPVVATANGGWETPDGWVVTNGYLKDRRTVLADPSPGWCA